MQHNLIVFNDEIVSAESLTGAITSTPKDISNIRSFCVQGKYTLTSASSEAILVEGSTDPSDEDMWTTISTFTLDDTEGNFMLNVEFPAYIAVRVNYTPTAASDGETTIRISGKV